MYKLNISYKQFYIILNEIWLYESDPNAAHLAANSGNTTYGADVIAQVPVKQSVKIGTEPQENITKCEPRVYSARFTVHILHL